MNCPHCQALTASDDIFCPQCGTKLAPAVQFTAPVKAVPPQAVDIRPGKALPHNLIRQLAAAYEYNSLSPLAALKDSEKKEGGKVSSDSEMLSDILQPEKTFCLTARQGNNLYQEMLLARGPDCCRWTDRNGNVVINREANPRSFIEHIYAVLARDITADGGADIILSRDEIPVLKAIGSLCSSLALLKVRQAFTTSGLLQQMLKSGNSLRDQLKALSKKGLINLAGTDDPLVRLTDKGRAMVGVLEDYDAFYTLQVRSAGRDEFASIYLVLNNGSLYLLSNPLNGEEVVVRAIDGPRLRSVLNWMWAADAPVK